MKPILRKVTPDFQASLNIRVDKGKSLVNTWHYHPEMEIVYIRKGAGTRLIGDNLTHFHGTDLVLLGPNLPHTFNHDVKSLRQKGKNTPEALVIHFREECLGVGFWDLPEMKEISKVVKLSRQGLQILGNSKKIVAGLMVRMSEEESSNRIILLLQMLDELANHKEYQVLAGKGYSYRENSEANEAISQIFQFTFANFHRKIAIDEVASKLSMSSQSFCRYFKKKTRKTYVEFLIEIRIGQACRLLLDSDLCVREIAYACGYGNISHFNHQFRKIQRQSPAEYRTTHQSNITGNIYTGIE